MTAGRPVPLTIVMPAYNEEDGIAAAVAEVQREVLAAVADAELIVVNDGSRDRTAAILDAVTATDARIRVIHQANRGHGRALRAGLDAAQGEYLLLLDSDRQIPLHDFSALWEAAQRHDALLGVRGQRRDPRIRLVISRLVRASVRGLFRVTIRDANAPFKVVRRAVWLEARRIIPEETLVPSLLLAVYLHIRGLDVLEVGVLHRTRATGTGSLRPLRLVGFCLRAFLQLLAFRRTLAA